MLFIWSIFTITPSVFSQIVVQPCVDKLHPRTGVSDCPARERAGYCNSTVYYDVMTEQCPFTCARCNSSSTGTTNTACVDKLNPRTGISDCPTRKYLCSNTVYFALMTSQCPFTCGRCSSSGTSTAGSTSTACVDKLNPITGVSDCPARERAGYCNSTVYHDVMTEQCPFTCGRCNSSSTATTNTACVDKVNPRTGISDCPTRKYLCSNTVYFALMTSQCPFTCGRCSSSGTSTAGSTSTGAVDKVNPNTGISDCPALKHLCENTLYYALMTEQCPVTCGRTSSVTSATGTSNTDCVDKVNPATGTSNCAAIANYCDNSLYFNIMTQQCPSTCGRCDGATISAPTAIPTTTGLPTTTTLPFIQTLRCETGWHMLLSTLSCYQAGDSRKTFSLAEADCQAMGGHLPSIHSLEENSFIRSDIVTGQTVLERQWIGYNTISGSLVTNDGTNVDYTKFASGEPNNGQGGTEFCIHMYSTTDNVWNDDDCDSEYFYVCKKHATPL